MKNTKNNNQTSTGVAFIGLLTIAFIILKLCNVINWSWVWVLSPLWISFGLYFAIVAMVIIMSLILMSIEDYKRKREL